MCVLRTKARSSHKTESGHDLVMPVFWSRPDQLLDSLLQKFQRTDQILVRTGLVSGQILSNLCEERVLVLMRSIYIRGRSSLPRSQSKRALF